MFAVAVNEEHYSRGALVMDAEQNPVLKALERALEEAERDVLNGEREHAQRVTLRDQLKAQVAEQRRRLDLPLGDEAPAHQGSLTQGIRDLLSEHAGTAKDVLGRTLTVKDIEHAVWARGYRSGASRFYWAVNGTLRSMADVVMVVKEGETSRFGLKSGLAKAPAGWTMVEAPRRTTSASRRAAPVPEKAKGRGGR